MGCLSRSLASRKSHQRLSESMQIGPTPAMSFSHEQKCSTHYRYGDFISCGDAYRKSKIDNTPLEHGSFEAIGWLSSELMDPIFERFGAVILTSGFRSTNLLRHIEKRVAPRIDQHTALEKNSRGSLICSRKGAAVDFHHPTIDSLTLAKFIVAELPFDRLYYYGVARPLHVSYGPEHSRKISNMFFLDRKDRFYPRNVSNEDFLKL